MISWYHVIWNVPAFSRFGHLNDKKWKKKHILENRKHLYGPTCPKGTNENIVMGKGKKGYNLCYKVILSDSLFTWGNGQETPYLRFIWGKIFPNIIRSYIAPAQTNLIYSVYAAFPQFRKQL